MDWERYLRYPPVKREEPMDPRLLGTLMLIETHLKSIARSLTLMAQAAEAVAAGASEEE
jgi:hypothetical protein